MIENCFTLTLDGPIVPKARARVTQNGAYHPPEYSQWKTQAILKLGSQYDGPSLSGVSIDITLNGKHSRRGDLDNIIGSLLDALVQAHILKNDNLTCVTSLNAKLNWSKKAEPETKIQIFQATR